MFVQAVAAGRTLSAFLALNPNNRPLLPMPQACYFATGVLIDSGRITVQA